MDQKILQEAKQYLCTLSDCIRFAVSTFNQADIFYGHGTSNAYEEAIALLMPTLHLPPVLHKEWMQARLLPHEIQLLLEMIQLRIDKRIPTPYLIHKAWFCGLEFYVDERVLIPRSPIGELIQNRFKPYLTFEPTRIMDLCTGSGCIAIALAKAFPEAEIDALDLSADALDVAIYNIESYGLDAQVIPIQSDLTDALPTQARYDLIVCNPPYVDAQDMDDLPEEFKVEPPEALAAGEDGLAFVHRILYASANHLGPKGLLVLEVGNSMVHLTQFYPDIDFQWVDLKQGGDGVCVLTAAQLHKHQTQFLVAMLS